MTSYADLSAAGLALGQVVSGSSVKRTFIEATADNLLKISGTSSSTACRLQGLAAPQGDDDAANRAYVQNFVSSQIRGLQLKQSVKLASTSNINIAGAGADALTTLRWSSITDTQDLMTLAAANSKTLNASGYLQTSTSKLAIGMKFTYPAGYSGSIAGSVLSFNSSKLNAPLSGAFIRRSGNSPIYLGSPQIEFGTGGGEWPVAAQPGIKFLLTDFPEDQDIYELISYDLATGAATLGIAKLVNGSFVFPTPLTLSNPYTVSNAFPPGSSDSTVPKTIRRFNAFNGGGGTVFKTLVISDSLTTMSAMFGPPPPSWSSSPGIDGVVPSAGDRLLLTGQTDAKQNGLWQVDTAGTTLARPADYAVGSAAGGCFVFVNGTGLTNDDKGFYCTTTPGQDIVDTNTTSWTVYTTGGGKLGTLSVGTDTITASSGTLSLINNALTTTGNITATQHKAGTLTLSQGSLVDSSGSISLGGTNVSTTGSVSTGTLTLSAGSLVDSSGSLSLGSTSVTTTGTVTSTHFYTSSDARLKEVISPLAPGITELVMLDPVRFKWKASGEDDTGLLAQDVQNVAPECVTEQDGFLKVDYSRLVPYLIAWIKQLSELVQSLS